MVVKNILLEKNTKRVNKKMLEPRLQASVNKLNTLGINIEITFSQDDILLRLHSDSFTQISSIAQALWNKKYDVMLYKDMYQNEFYLELDYESYLEHTNFTDIVRDMLSYAIQAFNNQSDNPVIATIDLGDGQIFSITKQELQEEIDRIINNPSEHLFVKTYTCPIEDF